jgi:hypothetical protein
VTDTGPSTPPPSPQAGWGSSPVGSSPTGPPPSTPVAHPSASTIAHPAAPRKRWLVVLIGVLVLIAGIAIAGTVLFAHNTWPPYRAAHDFTSDLEDGDVSGAYANLCARLTGPGRRSDFEDFANQIRRGLDHMSMSVFQVDRNGDRATVDFTVVHDVDRHTDLSLVLVREDDDWRVCDVRFRG